MRDQGRLIETPPGALRFSDGRGACDALPRTKARPPSFLCARGDGNMLTAVATVWLLSFAGTVWLFRHAGKS